VDLSLTPNTPCRRDASGFPRGPEPVRPVAGCQAERARSWWPRRSVLAALWFDPCVGHCWLPATLSEVIGVLQSRWVSDFRFLVGQSDVRNGENLPATDTLLSIGRNRKSRSRDSAIALPEVGQARELDVAMPLWQHRQIAGESSHGRRSQADYPAQQGEP